MSKDMSFPLEAVGEAAATELAGETLLDSTRPRVAAAAATAGRRWKDLWETELKWLSLKLNCVVVSISLCWLQSFFYRGTNTSHRWDSGRQTLLLKDS